MKTYLIRELGDTSGRILGMANAENPGDLFYTLDEYVNPNCMEFLRITGTCVCIRSFYMSDDPKDMWFNDELAGQIPATDADLAEFGEDAGEVFKTRHQWKTLVQLCGGEEKFWEMYEGYWGTGSRRVAGLMRNDPLPQDGEVA